MPDLKFSGASDDLIEVEGVVEEEFNTDRGEFYVVAPDGRQAHVRVDYGENGCWMVGIRPADEEIMGFDATVRFNGYTAELTLDVPDKTKVTRLG